MNTTRRGWFIVPIMLLLTACAPSNGRIELPQQYRLQQAPLAAAFERRSGRIALLDANGDLLIMDQTGGNVVKITTAASVMPAQSQSAPTTPLETFYHYPVWSPDASQIAFVEVAAERVSSSRVIELGAASIIVRRGEQSLTIQQNADGSTVSRSDPNSVSVASQPNRVIIETSTGGSVLASAIYLARTDGKASLRKLHSLDAGMIGYPDWSPDGSQLAFLSQAQQGGFDLNVMSIDAGEPRRILTSGAAAAWNWRPDGKALLARVDTSANGETSDLAVWDVQTGEQATVFAQDIHQPFDAPAYSPDGNAMLLTVTSNGRNYLALADGQGNITHRLSPIAGHINYVWSPTGALVAYIDTAVNTRSLQAPIGGALHVLDVNTGVDTLITQLPVKGFFWSPDGQRLATFTPVPSGQMSRKFPGMDLTSSQPNSVFILQTINVNTRQARQLFYLEPTDMFSLLLDQFDRFSHSMNIWSPDSGHLALSIIDANRQESIIETEASGSIEPRTLSKGTLAVWSPR